MGAHQSANGSSILCAYCRAHVFTNRCAYWSTYMDTYKPTN